ncbi:MAG: hypothetical protein JOY94_14055, partial [Methylobacteriaceae bacterium]|nr:hypothetical protein [Methylobacteriaceae bacterium]
MTASFGRGQAAVAATRDLICGIALAILLCLAWGTPARADPIDDTLARFASDKFPETEKAIGELAASDAKTAAAILDALGENRLLFNPSTLAAYYKDAAGTLFDAKTGEKAAGVEAGGLKKVRLNNAVRSAIDAALGSLRLFAPDAATRLDAAEAVFKSHEPAALPSLTQALAKETDA